MFVLKISGTFIMKNFQMKSVNLAIRNLALNVIFFARGNVIKKVIVKNFTIMIVKIKYNKQSYF